MPTVFIDLVTGLVVVPQATGTPIGDMTGGGNLAAAFDSNLSQTFAGSQAAFTASNGTTGFIGKDWGVGVTKIIGGFDIYGSSDQGFDNGTTLSVTVTLLGHTANIPGSATTLGSLTFTDPDNGTIQSKMTGIDVTTAYRYHWLKVETSSAATRKICAECILYELA